MAKLATGGFVEGKRFILGEVPCVYAVPIDKARMLESKVFVGNVNVTVRLHA